jgi:hypothetical protein
LPAKTTLNATNLEALGARRLAELVVELAAGDAAAKRRLRLELAGRRSPDEVARAVRKRLVTVARAGSLLDNEGERALVRDLDAHRRVIVEQLAPTRPDEALDLMWRLLELEPGVVERCGWRGDAMIALFDEAIAALGPLIDAARPEPRDLADRLARYVVGEPFDGGAALVDVVAPRLDEVGRGRLRERLQAVGGDGTRRADRRERARRALAQLADLEGDVDAYVALWTTDERRAAPIAAAIARRLLAAGRAEAAVATLEAGRPPGRRWAEWDHAYADALEATGDTDAAQRRRWRCFTETLDADQLRAHLKRLPDFDDVEAEKRALAHARGFERMHAALAFLLRWPAPREAARLVIERAGELDGNRYDLLTPAAEALGEKHPRAATLLRRAMIDFTLREKRTTRYGHAARHLRACEELASRIDDDGAFETHAAFRRRLEAEHGRKLAFWSRLD